MIKVLIADDHPFFLEGLKTALTPEDGMYITGEAQNGKEVIRNLKTNEVDVVLLDIKMPILDGLETAKYIQKKYPQIKTIILSNYNKNGFVKKAKEYGCSGYLLKDCGKPELVKAIKTVYEGGLYFNPKNGKNLSNEAVPAILSDRELEILKLIAIENCSRTIAEKLNIAPNTVKTHRERLMIKAGVKNTPGLVYWAMKNNYIE